jgi:glutaredoxin
MKVRFFGSSECKDCLEVFVLLNKAQVEYEYVDAHDENYEIQDLCDENDVNELPHLQFIDDEENIVIEHVGYVDDNEFMLYLINYFPNY